MHILVAEENASAARLISDGLEAEHYNVQIAAAGTQVLRMIEQRGCDLLILDLALPGTDALAVLRQVRSVKPNLLVLIVAGSVRVEDRVDGLNSGADDYLTKPFAFAELLARVRALLRRSSIPFESILHNMDLELDRVRHAVQRNGRAIELTPKEFALLEYLMLNAGSNVSRSSIIHHVWKLSADTMTNVVDVYINYLRKKIDTEASERIIHTVRGAGYRIGAKSNAFR